MVETELLSAARQAYDQGRLDTAERHLTAVLAERSNCLEALVLLGVICARAGRIPEATGRLQAALSQDPKNFDALSWLALVKKSQAMLPEAIELFQRAARERPNDATVFNHLGLCWLDLHQPIQAGAAFRQAITLEPGAGQGYHNLGMALKLGGSSFEAFHTFKRAAEIDPEFIGNYVQLFKQVQHLLNWQEAVPTLEQGFAKHPNSTALMVALATVYGKVGRNAEAEKLFSVAAKSDPTAGPPYSHWLQEEGRFEDSVTVLRESIRLSPIQGLAYYNLAVAKCFQVDGRPLAEVANEVLAHPGLRLEARMFLHYTLARSHEVNKEFGAAMQHYDSANELAYRAYNSREQFDPVSVHEYLEGLKRLYTPDTLEDISDHGSPSEVPVFIVGMIRSGTTLLDQILSSHPSIQSAGEQPFWHLMADRTNARWGQEGPSSEDVTELAQRYLKTLEATVGVAPRITDKMPTNYQYLGLMHAVFPRARFIHLRRAPVDTGLSIYTTYLGNATNFAYNRRNIVGTYKAYLAMMEFWRSVIPVDRMIEVDYEKLVTDREAVIRRLVEFCGLEWDDACLSHELNRSQVSTPSLFTARQPVHSASVERWRQYEPWLGELAELIGLSHPATRGH